MFSGNYLTETFKTPPQRKQKNWFKETAIRFWNQTTYQFFKSANPELEIGAIPFLYFLHTLIHSGKQKPSLCFNIKVNTTDSLEILWKYFEGSFE